MTLIFKNVLYYNIYVYDIIVSIRNRVIKT